MKLQLIGLIAFSALILATCKHEIPSPLQRGGPPVVSGTCDPDSVYFANSILPLLTSSCAMSGCHDPVTHEEDLILNSYSGIMKIVKPGSASSSKLYEVITTTSQGDVMPPPPHSPFTAANINAIQKWINQGAKNNQCVAPCDTSVYTYALGVAPIMNTYCKGCHNPAALNAGIDLSKYDGVKAIALNGKLTGSIKHSTGFIAMPQGGNKLQDCQIRQIEKWIEAGSLNN
ncbi:MAG TPA: c-type cytochrome domain-containing protein [Chitinophagaceae bacterium]